MTPPTRPTWIAVVLDHSGSMASMRDDAIGGFNVFLEEQQQQEGLALLFLAQFDDTYEVLVDGLPLADAPRLTRATFVPRGSTALHDAIGRMVTGLERRMEHTQAAERPGAVTVLVVTDGEENASRTFTAAEVARLVRVHEEMHGWRFLFFGSNAEAVVSASQDLGMDGSATVMFSASGRGVRDAFGTASARITSSRTVDCMAERHIQGEDDPRKKMN